MQSFKRSMEIIAVVSILAIFSVFAVQNSQSISLHFIRRQSPEMPVFMVILLSILLGCLSTLLVCLSDLMRARRHARRLEKQLATLEEQLTMIKQQPILDNFSAHVADDDEPHDATTQPTLYPRTR